MTELDGKWLTKALAKADLVLVSREWFDLAVRALDGKHGCPFCGSDKEYVSEETSDEHERKGCLDCGEWWSPVRLKR